MANALGLAPPQSLIPNRLAGMRVQTSLYGKAMPIVYGAQRLAANLIWYGDFQAIPAAQAQGGKGLLGGGGKSGQNYIYYAAIAALLCEGPIIGIGNVWDSQGTLIIESTTVQYTVPSGGGSTTPTPPSGGNYYADLGVGRADAYSVGPFTDYGSPGPVTLSGTQQTPMEAVPSSPGAGQYVVNGTTGQYTFSGADAGKVVSITYVYVIPENVGGGKGSPPDQLQLTVFVGDRPQTPWGYLTSKHPQQALGYSGIAYIANSDLYLGSSGELPGLSFEVLGFESFGAGIPDCDPMDIVEDLLTNAFYGYAWPSSWLDLAGTWANWSDYCVANGLFLSLSLDTQRTGTEILKEICQITNSEPVWSGNILKIVTYGDTTAVGNGATFSPNTTPIYDLDDDDYISGPDQDPVQITINSVADAYNDIKIEYADRGNAYNPEIVESKDDAAIAMARAAGYGDGVRPQDPLTFHEITSGLVAAKVADLQLQRSVYIRNTYEFTIGWRYSVLEPMDMVTLTDANLGLSKTPVRLVSIEEDQDGNLKCTAEEFPWGTAHPTLYPKETNTNASPNSVAAPGSINAPVLFEANNRVTGQVGQQLWMAVSGADMANWGGCHVWLSLDGVNYKQISDIYGHTAITSPARMGFTTAAFPSHADPDTVDTLSVDLTQSQGALTSGTTADADADRTLCLVDSELIAYSTATLTNPFQYNLTSYIRRGQLTSAIAAHSIGAPFVRLDSAVFRYQYDPSLIGQTIYLKFTSFNLAQQQEQGLADATAYTYTIIGNYLGLLSPAHATYRPLSNPLTGHDAGSSATINIAAFTMRVAGVDLPISSGSITGLSYNTLYYVFYDDAPIVGGAVTFQDTTTKEVAILAAGRFFVGSITTPRAGAPDTIGNNDGGSGAQNGMLNVFAMSVAATNNLGNGTVVNIENAVDGDLTTQATLTVTGNGASNKAEVVLSAPPGLTERYDSINLKIRVNVTTDSVTPQTGQVIAVAGYSTTGPNGSFSPLVNVAAPNTQTPITLNVVIPRGTNLSQVAINFLIQTQTSMTSGQVIAGLLEAWIEAVQ